MRNGGDNQVVRSGHLMSNAEKTLAIKRREKSRMRLGKKFRYTQFTRIKFMVTREISVENSRARDGHPHMGPAKGEIKKIR